MSLVADAMSGEQEKRPPVFSYARGGDLRPGVVQTGEPQPPRQRGHFNHNLPGIF